VTRFRHIALAAVFAAGACSDPAPATGSLIVTIGGLPAGVDGSVTVTGPNGYSTVVRATTTLEPLEPGAYLVRIQPVNHDNAIYAQVVTEVPVTVTAGRIGSASVTYALASGLMDLTVTGLPPSSAAYIRLFGPLGFSRTINAGGVIGELPPGTYTLRADTITSLDGDRYAAALYTQPVVVEVSLTPVPVTVAYGIASGSLAVSLEGLPTGNALPAVTVTGPGGFQRVIGQSTTYRGLAPGTYTLSAAKVFACPDAFVPSQLSQTAEVTVAGVAARTSSYSATRDSASGLNLRIDAAHLVQVTQNYRGTVAMIAGRPALLRVFGVANQCNSAAPKVRVTLNGTVLDLAAGSSSVTPLADEGVLLSTWNYAVPAALVQPGLTLVAEIDPDNAVAEADETDNRYPATGAKEIDVRAVPMVRVMMVPVTFSANNSTGDVSAANVEQYLDLSRRIHPVLGYDVAVREPFTTSQPLLQTENQNGAWSRVLQEIAALRIADADESRTTFTGGGAATGDRRAEPQPGAYYFGVVKTTYSSGVAGVGFIGQPASIGWDRLPSGSVVVAHELGHNFGRLHTPCGNPGGVDQSYPTTGRYAGGFIGAFGYDAQASKLIDPAQYTDVMGYCSNPWISDYTYMGMLRWVQQNPLTQPVVSGVAQPSVFLWGRIVNGRPELEPAFEIHAPPTLPKGGPHRLSALDANGREILGVSFSGERIADLPGDDETFSIVVPRRMLEGRRLAALRLSARGRTVTATQSVDVAEDPNVRLSRAGSRAIRVQWNAAKFPVVLVRDPVNGRVLSFARGGDATVVSARDELELNYSNRVGSARRLERVKR